MRPESLLGVRGRSDHPLRVPQATFGGWLTPWSAKILSDDYKSTLRCPIGPTDSIEVHASRQSITTIRPPIKRKVVIAVREHSIPPQIPTPPPSAVEKFHLQSPGHGYPKRDRGTLAHRIWEHRYRQRGQGLDH